jgi:hypothetical protein
MRSMICTLRTATITLIAALAAVLAGCADAPDPDSRAAALAAEVVIQPSCIPNVDSDGDHDDGESCGGVADDNFCDALPSPSPTVYCVTCTAHGSGCYPYPADAP